MSVDPGWEAIFRDWANPPSRTERDKAENAERAVQGAFDGVDYFRSKGVTIAKQGSYRALTNVRQDSDVDICVCLTSTYYYDLPSRSDNPSSYGIVPISGDDFFDFKNQVEQALVDKFGRASVTRGNKAFDIHETSSRLDADVLAAFEYRRYWGPGQFYQGTKFFPDKGGVVINWPDQNYQNGVEKNKATGQRYKAMVRVVKRLRNYMEEKNVPAARNIPSTLVEGLVWNVPNEGFNHEDYADDVRYVLAHVFNETLNSENCKEWGEINELKYLFRPGQPWTREQAHEFVSTAWDFIGFE